MKLSTFESIIDWATEYVQEEDYGFSCNALSKGYRRLVKYRVGLTPIAELYAELLGEYIPSLDYYRIPVFFGGGHTSMEELTELRLNALALFHTICVAEGYYKEIEE